MHSKLLAKAESDWPDKDPFSHVEGVGKGHQAKNGSRLID